MGKAKLRIRRLETAYSRQVTYSKRKPGLIKKATELSILCDIDLALLTFSPLGKATVFVGRNNDLSSVAEKFSRMFLQDRLKRRIETLELLKKLFAKENHEIDPDKFLPDGKYRHQALLGQLKDLQEKITEKSNKLRTWLSPENINDKAKLQEMENSIVESLDRVKSRKDSLYERRARKPWIASQATRKPWISQTQLIQDKILEYPNPELVAQGDFGYKINGNGQN